MSELRESADQGVQQPTMLESQLDSICFLLGQMKTKVRKVPVLDHMTDLERRRLDAALARVEEKVTELSATLRGSH